MSIHPKFEVICSVLLQEEQKQPQERSETGSQTIGTNVLKATLSFKMHRNTASIKQIFVFKKASVFR